VHKGLEVRGKPGRRLARHSRHERIEVRAHEVEGRGLVRLILHRVTQEQAHLAPADGRRVIGPREKQGKGSVAQLRIAHLRESRVDVAALERIGVGKRQGFELLVGRAVGETPAVVKTASTMAAGTAGAVQRPGERQALRLAPQRAVGFALGRIRQQRRAQVANRVRLAGPFEPAGLARQRQQARANDVLLSPRLRGPQPRIANLLQQANGEQLGGRRRVAQPRVGGIERRIEGNQPDSARIAMSPRNAAASRSGTPRNPFAIRFRSTGE
jgi:hypothetical protein